MAYNTKVSLDKLTCNDYVDFRKCKDRFGRFFWSKKDSNYLDVKLKVFKKDDKKKLLPGLESNNGRGRVEAVHAIENSAGHRSRKLRQRKRFVTSGDTNNVQRQG